MADILPERPEPIPVPEPAPARRAPRTPRVYSPILGGGLRPEELRSLGTFVLTARKAYEIMLNAIFQVTFAGQIILANEYLFSFGGLEFETPITGSILPSAGNLDANELLALLNGYLEQGLPFLERSRSSLLPNWMDPNSGLVLPQLDPRFKQLQLDPARIALGEILDNVLSQNAPQFWAPEQRRRVRLRGVDQDPLSLGRG